MSVFIVIGAAFAGTWALVQERREDALVLPSPDERARYAALVRDVARTAPSGIVPADARARAEALGLSLLVEPGFAWLVEPTDRLRGGGVVAFRLGPAAEIVLQAPHPTSDLHTGPIVAALFDAGDIRAACFATVHRRASEGADPARSVEGLLQAATQGLADGLADPLFVQVHGFGAGTTPADLVVSEGASRADPATVAAAGRRIAAALEAADARLGTDVPALAARGNVQGRFLADRARFLHIELSLPLRLALADDLGGERSAPPSPTSPANAQTSEARRRALSAALRDLARREVPE